MQSAKNHEMAVFWKKRWKLVREVELRELRTTAPEICFKQLCALASTAIHLKWDGRIEHQELRARRNWQRLRKIAHDRPDIAI
jgi:hypothetical protein